MPLPEWIRTGSRGASLHATRHLLRGKGLSTVCEEAKCPNQHLCFSKPTATFLILGAHCTRRCGFCAIGSGDPVPVDPHEPGRVADAAAHMGLRYVVITSVTRDDLPDGGAAHFAATIQAVRDALPEAKVEVLTPDFLGSDEALGIVLDARPDVFNHNIETVRRLYPVVRPQADYGRSLDLLRRAAQAAPHIATKSGLMLGLGETVDEVVAALRDLREAACGMVTIGQYLRPSKKHLPVVEYIRPERFDALAQIAFEQGFESVASAPLVRSSMNAEEMLASVRNRHVPGWEQPRGRKEAAEAPRE